MRNVTEDRYVYYCQDGGNCVEFRLDGSGLRVRDGKNRGGAVLTFVPAATEAFAHAIRAGRFDRS